MAAGDMEAAVLAVLVRIMEMTDEEIDAFRSSPRCRRFGSARTLPRECRVEDGWVYEPGQFDAITAPTMLLAGSESPADLAKATLRASDAIPNTRTHVLEGHAHMAHKADPAMVADRGGLGGHLAQSSEILGQGLGAVAVSGEDRGVGDVQHLGRPEHAEGLFDPRAAVTLLEPDAPFGAVGIEGRRHGAPGELVGLRGTDLTHPAPAQKA